MTQTANEAAAHPARETVDRWIEALQIQAGTADNPTAAQLAEMAATRRQMLAAVHSETIAEAVEAGRSEYLAEATGDETDGAYNRGVADAVAAVSALA